MSAQRWQFDRLVAIRSFIGGGQLDENAALMVTPCRRVAMEVRSRDEGADLFQRIRQRWIDAIVQGNRNRVKRCDVDILGDSIRLGDLDAQQRWIAAKRVRAGNDAAEPEYPGLGK